MGWARSMYTRDEKIIDSKSVLFFQVPTGVTADAGIFSDVVTAA